ncbi:MAG: DNA polymerase III subunit delta [Methyloligellaceae bacterium]
MVALKAGQTASFIENPDMRYRATLVYGPEPALVSERARALAKKYSALDQTEAELVRLNDRDLAEEPDRLAIELQTRSMFAERSIVHVKAERRLRPEDISTLIDTGFDAVLIVEAGNLRPSARLRKVFEESQNAVALPCYADPAKDIAAVIDQEIVAGGFQISREVRTYLANRLGEDAALARSECNKLATYVAGAGTINLADVDAAIGDLGAGLVDALASAVAEGETERALAQLDALLASGSASATVLSALGRHFQRLHRLCAAVEGGEPPRNAIAKFKPPLHFRQRDTLLLHAKRWRRTAAARALAKVQDTTRRIRTNPSLERELTSKLVIELSR